MWHGSSLEELLNHSHIAEHIVPLPLLVSVCDKEIDQQAKETDTDVYEVVPEGTCESSEGLEGMGGEGAVGEGVLQDD